jgi:hypothetical protein
MGWLWIGGLVLLFSLGCCDDKKTAAKPAVKAEAPSTDCFKVRVVAFKDAVTLLATRAMNLRTVRRSRVNPNPQD